MDYKKTILILSLVFCLLFAVSSVCASDINENNATDDSLEITEDNQIIEETESDEDILQDNELAFIMLQVEINKISDEGSITLNNNYCYFGENDKNEIEITKSIHINGNGKTLDGKGLASTFNVKNNAELWLNNVKIVNCAIDQGGAIYIGSGAAHLTNCEFENNVAQGNNLSCGGAILNNGMLTISDSTFKNNHATCAGGAIYNNNYLEITNTIFINNDATKGGAIYSEDDATVKINDTKMTGNHATGNGGAIFSFSTNLTITNSSFENNWAENGGAIHIEDNKASITNATFKYNIATGNGGAINNRNGELTIIKSIFKDNNATGNGGAITSNTLTMENSLFEHNYANKTGGAIAVYYNSQISNTNFTNCQARTGGAIYAYAFMLLTQCNLKKNKADNGGAIGTGESDLKIYYSNLTDNTAMNGGAIHSIFALTLENSILANNTATQDGGAIYTTAASTKIQDSTLTNNKATANGGAIYNTGKSTVKHCNLTSHTAIDGGAIYNTGESIIQDSTLTNNKAAANGGAVYTTDTSEIQDITLTNNTANANGGAIYNTNLLRIFNSNLTYNTGNNGGAVYNLNSRLFFVKESELTDNKAKNGGAIYSQNTTTQITKSKLIGNNATENGGAVYSQNSSVEITGKELTYNKASNGGAIYSQNSPTTITGTKLTGSEATDQGGAIYNLNSTLIMENSELTDNRATNNGGAIYTQNSTVTISKSKFKYNGGEYGGAIFSEGRLNLTDTLLEENYADYGAGIMSLVEASITNSNFTQNHAYDIGGAIQNKDGRLTIQGSSFKNNTAMDGGAINGKIGNIEISNSEFANCEAQETGGAIYTQDTTLTIRDSKFKSNTAKNGGAVAACRSTISTENTTFMENIVTQGGVIFLSNDSSANISENITFIDNTNNLNPVYAVNSTADTSKAKYETTISFEICHIEDGLPNSKITVTVLAKMLNNNVYTGPVVVNIADANYTIEIVNGTGTSRVELPNLDIGKYNATINFNQTNYLPTTAKSNAFAIVSETSLTGLRCTIDNANDTLILSHDYTFDSLFDANLTNGITINKNLTIYGKGMTIDAKGNARIFNIFENANVTLINLNLINGKAIGGAAILISDSSLTITDSTLDNNTASEDSSLRGGAIFSRNSILEISKCNITNNQAIGRYYYGGAIALYSSTTTISSSRLENNHVIGTHLNGNGGGAIYTNSGEITIINSTLTKNTVTGEFSVDGGAIYNNNAALTIINTEITNNNVTGNIPNGGAIYCQNGEVRLNNATISNNLAENNGGGIYCYNCPNLTINNSIFSNNTATRYNGGAIQIINGKVTINNTQLANNSANSSGGAVNNRDHLSIYNSIIISNDAEIGGAINNDGTAIIVNTTFKSNQADTAGAINNNNVLTIMDSTIKSNNATNTSGILTKQSENLTINNTIFVDNTDNENSIYSENGEVNKTQIRFLTSLEFEIDNINDFIIGNTITLKVSELKKGEKFNGQVTVSIGLESYTIDIVNGTGSTTATPNLKPGKYTAKLTFAETSEYESASCQSNAFQVSINPEIKIQDITNIEKDGQITLNISAREFFTDNVNVEINGVNYTVTVINGSGARTITPNLEVGSYKAVINYPGNENYTAVNVEGNQFNVTPKSTIITFQTNATIYGSGNDIVVKLTDKNGAAVTDVEVNVEISNAGTKTLTTDENGEIKIRSDDLAANSYTATITFNGNTDYSNSSATSPITVKKATTKLNATEVKATYNDDKYSVVTLTDSFNKALAGVLVRVNLNGVENYTTDANGQIKIPVTGLAPNTYTAKVTFAGNENYTGADASVNLTIEKATSKITATEVTTTYNTNKDLIITLTNNNNKPLAGVLVTVDLNGVKSYTTDANGQVKIPTKGLAPNTYTAKVSFAGNENYIGLDVTAKVIVKKATAKITAKTKTFKASLKTKKYAITLKDSEKGISKVKVSIKVKGKTYTAKTSSNGKATFKITKLTKKGKFTATVTFKGNSYYNKTTKKVKIIVK